MSDITIEITQTEITFSLQTPVIQIDFPTSLPGVLLPDDGNVGDVLTWDGAAWGPEPPGAAGNLEVWEAGENLSAGKIVIIDGGEAVYFQPANATHAGRAYGVTSATAGNDVTIQIAGQVSDPAFAFVAESGLYAAANGSITETKPLTPLIQYVGFAVDAGTMKIQFWPTIQ